MSYKLEITYNPFKNETIFELYEGAQKELFNNFNDWNGQRLQRWIHQLFPRLSEVFQGETDFTVIFNGVEADIIDMEEAVANANKHGMNIRLIPQPSLDSEERLEQMQELMEEAQQNPLFAEKLKNGDVKSNFEDALNRDFDVCVAATMSAGKSTFINGMLGTELLPNANEATTATIAEITNNDSRPIGEFEGYRENHSGNILDEKQIVTLEILTDWNKQKDTSVIKLDGKIIGITERDNVRVILTDTPGPNNSQDKEHKRITLGHIQGKSERKPLILYLLNATQLGTDDDKKVLNTISELMAKDGKEASDRFIFIVNKCDQFDPEKGEKVETVLENVKEYLESNGIENPQLFPISAHLAYLFRKKNEAGLDLTRAERAALNGYEELFLEEDAMDLAQYMPLTCKARERLNALNSPKVLKRSGVPAIEIMVDEYVNKYNLPHRVNRAYEALKTVLKASGDEENLNIALAKCNENLETIQVQLKTLQNNQNIGAKAKVKMQEAIKNTYFLYGDSDGMQEFKALKSKLRNLMNEFQTEFYSDNSEAYISEQTANRLIDKLTRNVEYESNKILNELDNIIAHIHMATKTSLMTIFDKYVKDFFGDLDDLPMPILDNFQAQMGNLAKLSLNLRTNEVAEKTRQVADGVETYEVSCSKWYNPFSWGKTETRTRTKYKNESYTEVNKEEVWSEREGEIWDYFSDLFLKAEEKIKTDVNIYAEKFASFLEKQFTDEFQRIIEELKAKSSDKSNLEKERQEAQQKLDEIAEFTQRLDKIVEVKDV